MGPVRIRHLADGDAEAYVKLRRAALAEAPLAFAASLQDDVVSTVEAVHQLLSHAPESVLLGAFEEAAAAGSTPALVGTVGLYRDRHRKASHKAHVWGMYVAPHRRDRGIGDRLLRAVLAHARALPGVTWVHLGVSSAAPAARRLYERAGFQVWGVEPQAVRHDGQDAFEVHMALSLDDGAPVIAARAPDASSGLLRVLAVSGSLRAGSSHAALLEAAARLAPAGMRIEVCDRIGSLPLFNPDLDGPVPPHAVAALRAQVAAADGLLISSPEYAHGLPGALKNALDWLVSGVEVLGKPVALLHASSHGAHARQSLAQVLSAMATDVIPEAAVTIPVAGRGLDAAAIVADPSLSAALQQSLAALTAAIERERSGVSAAPAAGPRPPVVRPYAADDHAEWQRMRTALWPGQTLEEMAAWLARPDAAVIVAEREPAGLCGFAEVGSRSYADGCATSPVAYLEGWYVDPDARRRGVGAALIRAVEAWARERGFRELASDTSPDNPTSQRAHARLGFSEQGHAVLYRKQL